MIPKDWRIQARAGQFAQENLEGITYLFIDKTLKTLKRVTSRKIYDSLIKDRIGKPTSQSYYEKKLNNTEIVWSQIYLLFLFRKDKGFSFQDIAQYLILKPKTSQNGSCWISLAQHVWNFWRNYRTLVSKLSCYNRFVAESTKKMLSIFFTPLPGVSDSAVHLGFCQSHLTKKWWLKIRHRVVAVEMGVCIF